MTGIGVRVGEVVHVPGRDRGYVPSPVTLRVTCVRYDLLSCYDDEWIWLEGYQVDGGAESPAWASRSDPMRDRRSWEGPWLQVLVRVAALEYLERR